MHRVATSDHVLSGCLWRVHQLVELVGRLEASAAGVNVVGSTEGLIAPLPTGQRTSPDVSFVNWQILSFSSDLCRCCCAIEHCDASQSHR